MSAGTPLWAVTLVFCLLMSLGWSALVLAASAAAAARALPAARDRHLVWWLALALCVLPLAACLWRLGLPSWGGAGDAPGLAFGAVLGGRSVAAAVMAAAPGPLTVVLGWIAAAAPLLLAVYGVGLAWRGAAWLRGRSRLARLLAACREVRDPALLEKVDDWAARLRLARRPCLLATSAPVSPFVTGWRNPVLVLPEALLGVGAAERTALVCAHELAHLRRGDTALIGIQSMLSALLWFNPFARAIARRLDASREIACDAMVLHGRADLRRAYAAAYVDTLRAAAMAEAHAIPFIHTGRKDREMRLKAILTHRSGQGRTLRAGLCCAVLAAALAPAAAVQAALAADAARAGANFTASPVEQSKSRLSSRFGPRVHPVTRKAMFHSGVDIAAPRGTEVRAAGAGRVRFAGRRGAYGLLVEIDHGNGWRTRYGQLQSYGVKRGEQVAAGQRIGTVGSTGQYATGPHLHLEVWKDKKLVDPAKFITLPESRKPSGE